MIARWRIATWLTCLAATAAIGALAPATGIRLFWHRGNDAATFWNAKHTDPIGEVQIYGSNVTVRPEEHGAGYALANPTQAQLLHNRKAIQKAIDSLPDNGGTLLISGSLQYSGTIVFPQRAFVPQLDLPRSIPFEIRGASPNAELINYAAAPAISIHANYSFQVGSTVAKSVVRNLTVYSKGVGILIRGGGKEVKLENVVIASCEKTGLEIDSFDGGLLKDIYCINNKGDGAHIEKAHQCQVSITCRGNAGNGLVIADSNSWDLWAYLEANDGYGLKARNFKWSNATLWQEANRGMKGQAFPQGKLELCQFDVRGNCGQDSNNAFEWDGFSRLNCPIQRTPADKYAPYELDLKWPPRGPRPLEHPIFERSVVNNEIKLAVKPGAYSKQPIDISQSWLELDSSLEEPLTDKRTFNQGDVVVVRYRVRASPEAAAYYKSLCDERQDVPTFKLTVIHAALGDGQNYYIRDTNECEIEVYAQATTTATDMLRVFLYVCPKILPGQEPATGHDLFITGRKIYVVPK